MTRFLIMGSVPAQAGRDLIAAIHGLDSLVGRRGHDRLLLSPLGLKGGPPGEPPRFGFPPCHLGVVCFGRGRGGIQGFHLRQCGRELSLRQIAGQDGLFERRGRDVVGPGNGVDLRLGFYCGSRKSRRGIGAGMGQDHPPIRGFALPFVCGHGIRRGRGIALVDVLNASRGNGVGGLQQVPPAIAERGAIGKVLDSRNHSRGWPSEIRVPGARAGEHVRGHGDEVGNRLRDRADLSKSGIP